MKILYINSLGTDYVQDLTYNGLVRTFGHRSIIDCPWNKKFHVPYRRYPKNIGFTGFHWPLFRNSRTLLKDFDYVFLAASKVDAFKTYTELIGSVGRRAKVIFIDGGDQPNIGGDLAIYGEPALFEEAQSLRPFDVVFKREYLVGDSHERNVFPLPMSFDHSRRPLKDEEAKYDVTFWAVESDPIRSQALDLLRGHFDCEENGTVRNQKFSRYSRKGSHYLRELKRSKIALNFRGGGWDTLRYWEIPAMGTPLMITQQPGIVIPFDYRDGQEVVYCKPDLSDLIDLISYYLKNECVRTHISSNAFNWSLLHHTTQKRVGYIFDCIVKFTG